MSRTHVNTHTVSGLLAADAEISELNYPRGGKKVFRFQFRIGCDRMSRRADGSPEKKTSWFRIQFEGHEQAKNFYEARLKKGAEVLLVGEQLINQVTDDVGTRYFHFLKAKTIQIIQEARKEKPSTAVTPQGRPQLAAVPSETPVRSESTSSRLQPAPPGPETNAPRKGQYAVDTDQLKAACDW